MDECCNGYKNILLIVDPQIDFISGSLKVNKADEAMDSLIEWIDENISYIDMIVVTMDWHPQNHCSFEKHGGIWPLHCVSGTEGAEIYPPLSDKLKSLDTRIEYIKKATSKDSEQYSAFQDNIPQYIYDAENIYLAGIAGDVCVRYTASDIRSHGYSGKLIYIKEAIAYINEEIRYE